MERTEAPGCIRKSIDRFIIINKTSNMKINMGTADRITRLILVIIIGVLYYTEVVTGALAAVLLILAVVFAITSFVGFCPIYTFLGINSRGLKKQ